MMSILMDNGLPMGGKFSFDKENKKRIPKECNIPYTYVPERNKFTNEALEYVKQEFLNAIGTGDLFLYPTNFSQARKALFDFIQNKLFFLEIMKMLFVKKSPYFFIAFYPPF